MIFAPDAIDLIRDRRKTQTRRAWPVCRVKVGQRYRVQPGRGQKGLLDITVVGVRQERLGDISDQDVRREGFRFRAQFEDRWRQLHGSWRPDLEVWVVSFVAGDLRDRFDRPRLLKATPGIAGDEVEEHQDYTERPQLAMADEPEAIDPQTAELYSKFARARDLERAKDPDAVLHRRLLAELERWEQDTGGVASGRDRQHVINRIRRELRTLERKLAA